MTKKDFLARCANAWDMGICRDDVLTLLNEWTDAIMRLEGGQFCYFVDFLGREKRRTNRFLPDATLANDKSGYDLIRLAAILTHPCQMCATDLHAWHTRSAFCKHGHGIMAEQVGKE